MEDANGNPIGFVLGNIKVPRRINYQIMLTKEQYEALCRGHSALSQDDKWIIFCRGNEFYFHRSSGRERIYQTVFSNMDNHGNFLDTYSCMYFFVEGDTSIYRAETDDANEANRFQDLITSLAK